MRSPLTCRTSTGRRRWPSGSRPRRSTPGSSACTPKEAASTPPQTTRAPLRYADASRRCLRWSADRSTYEEITARDKVSLDLFWLRDESLEDSASLPEPHVLAQGIADDSAPPWSRSRMCSEISSNGSGRGRAWSCRSRRFPDIPAETVHPASFVNCPPSGPPLGICTVLPMGHR